ncbi:phage Gp37/Gp68 family protein [Thalassobaculum litoreum]|uniref:Protein gp37 n=1 Tax=Thalassobaculum litoreum DSM 18839 TaxID=1123362 RepID=A0A8G2EYW1_9PROT|nr:phage Gp37/Gp68 family protein [Thalassobaculum litoreum]SDF82684.1 protein gp37 [Thalassobaculum litoreum DSM 18839]
MADGTHIEWTDATWNPITGCSVVSPGCTNCYAMKLAGTRLQHHPSRQGLTMDTKAGPVWSGEVRFNEGWLDQPIRWRKPKRIFVCAHGDLFHEAVPDEWIDQVFAVMALCPQHTFQVLTKRPGRMRAWFEEKWQGTLPQTLKFPDGTSLDIPAGGETGRRVKVEAECELFLRRFGLADPEKDHLWTDDGNCKAMQWQWPLPNVWLGVSVEDQARADERVPLLLDTPAAVRWVSAEPLLGPVDFTNLREYNPTGKPWIDALRGLVTRGDYLARSPSECSMNTSTRIPGELPSIEWVVVGGESGRDARPMHPVWARSLRDQCVAAGVPFHFKQWGTWHSALEHDPASHPDDVTTIAMNRVGEKVYRSSEVFRLGADPSNDDWQTFCEVGKKAAGRQLDGATWDQYPVGSGVDGAA